MIMPSEDDLYICNLSEEVQKISQQELNEDPETRDKFIQDIRQWLKENPHLNARTDAKTLIRYLRGSKFNLEKTKTKLEMYYTCKAALPDLFRGRDPLNPTIRQIFNLRLMVPLPGYDELGRRIVLGRLGAWDPAQVRPEDLFKAASMLYEVLFLEDEQNSVTGFVQVHDMTGITFRHAASLTLPLVRKVMTVWTEGYPTRPKAVHYIHTPPAFDTVFALFNTFMKEKMKKRVKVHGSDVEALYKYVPKNLLPEEYGGTNGTLQEHTDYWIERMEYHRQWFLDDEKHIATINHRKERPKSASDIFTRDTSIKKLEID